MKRITVHSRDYAGEIKKSWAADLVGDDGDLIELYGVFDVSFDHPYLGHIPIGMLSYEYYWQSRWYNVFRFHEPNGAFRGFYCNVNMPPVLSNDVLDYVDLDIDVIVSAAGKVVIVDEDEFKANAKAHDYPPELRSNAKRALKELQQHIGSGGFPFSGLPASLQQNT